MNTVRICIIEDDREINKLLAAYLSKEGYITDSAYDGTEALSLLTHNEYHLVILDLMLPGIDGYELLRRIRERGHAPVMILSAKSEETDKIIGLGLGADDYMTKPFSIGELTARAKALLRRYLYFTEQQYQAGREASIKAENPYMTYRHLKLNLLTYELQVGDRTVSLTAKEFDILKLFMSHPSRVYTKAQIFNQVWGEHFIADDNTVMVHIRRLRTKIEKDPSNPTCLVTVWGIGYKLGEGEE